MAKMRITGTILDDRAEIEWEDGALIGDALAVQLIREAQPPFHVHGWPSCDEADLDDHLTAFVTILQVLDPGAHVEGDLPPRPAPLPPGAIE